jgi:hypothetical protein
MTTTEQKPFRARGGRNPAPPVPHPCRPLQQSLPKDAMLRLCFTAVLLVSVIMHTPPKS